MDEQNMEYAGFWARLGAMIIDVVLLMMVVMPLMAYFYGWSYLTDDKAPLIRGLPDLLINWVFPIIAILLFWHYKQATPGKMALSLRIVDAETGGRMSGGQLIGRYFAYIVSAIPFFLGYLWVAFDGRKQAWHDKLAGTVVVRGKAPAEPGMQ